MKTVKIINWIACLLFLASLFQPMERHALAGPCGWPCLYPFTYTVIENSFTFVFSLVFLLFQMLFWNGFKIFFIAVVYLLIGIGEILLVDDATIGNQNQLRAPTKITFGVGFSFGSCTTLLRARFQSSNRF